MYFLLTEVRDVIAQYSDDNPSSEKRKQIAIEKLKAFLEFPFLIKEQFNSPAADEGVALTNIYKYAPEEVRPLLDAKMRSQNALFNLDFKYLNLPVASTVFELKYADISGVANPHSELLNGSKMLATNPESVEFPARLFNFAKFFCLRMNQFLHTETPIYRDADRFLSLLDSMSRILEVDSMCTAVTFAGGKFLISSNYGSANLSRSARQGIFDKLKEQVVPELLLHLSQYKKYSPVDKSTKGMEFLQKVVPGYVENICQNPQKAKSIMKQISEEGTVSDLVVFCYQNSNEIAKRINKSEDACDDLIFMFSNVLEYVGESFPVCKGVTSSAKKKELCNLVYRIYRLSRDLKKLEDAVSSDSVEKLFPGEILSAPEIKTIFEMVPNNNFVHTESALLNYIIHNGIIQG